MERGFSTNNLLAYLQTRREVQAEYERQSAKTKAPAKKKAASKSKKPSSSKTKASSKNSKNATLTQALKKVADKKKTKRAHKYDDETGMIPATKNFKRDQKLNAMQPGRRISKNGKRYYERRSNRCD